MSNKNTYDKELAHYAISWIFAILFFVLGILNLIFIHPVPGLFYMLIALIYLPFTNKFLKVKFGFSIPIAIKIIVGIVILWGTLAVGDLMEMFESWMNH